MSGRNWRAGSSSHQPDHSIINGERAVTGDTALRLAHFFGTSEEFWSISKRCTNSDLRRRKFGAPSKSLPRSLACGRSDPGIHRSAA